LKGALAASLNLAVLLLFPVSAQAEINALQVPWQEILDEAKDSKRHLYVAFLGDGWSLSSKRFEERLLQTPEFEAFAAGHLLRATVRARTQPRMPPAETARLQSLVIHLDIRSYPTLLIIAPDGREVLRHGYREEDPESYVGLLKALLPTPPVPEPG